MTVAVFEADGRLRRAPAATAPAFLIVLLHGVGSSAAAMEPIAEALGQAFPEAAVTALNGYDASDLGGAGRQWFSVRGVTAANRAGRVADALPRVEALIGDEARHWGLDLSRTVVVGFSQGAIMGLALASSSARPPRAVVSLAGRVALPVAPGPGPRPPVLLSHGTSDPVMPLAELDIARDALTKAGCAVEVQTIPSLVHAIHPQQIVRAIQFIKAVTG